MLPRFPILLGFSGYKADWLRYDVTAGLAVAAVAIPSAIAYPAIAGLPVEVGIYSSILPLLGYALFGPSRQLIIGPDAATMTVLAAVLASMSAATPADRVVAAAALALSVGVLCIAAAKLGLGAIAAFLSRPILIGFISGISISILVGQIGRFTGVRIEADGLFPPFIELFQKVDLIHWPSVMLGVTMFALLLLLGRLRLPIPGPLIVVVMAGVASALFDFEGRGIQVVGGLPEVFPALSFPSDVKLSMRELLLGAGAVWLVSLSSGLVAARSFGARGKFEVEADKELVGFGAANIASGLFSGFPVTVSDSRTAINMSAGGRSQMSGLVAAFALTMLLLYLNNALRLLPIPALGAILAAAALSLIDIAGLREIWRVSRLEFVFALISMWGAISLGVLSGVVIAVSATLLYVLLKEMRPRDAMLGRIAGKPGFYKLHRSRAAQPVPGLAVNLIQGSILFFNADYVRTRLEGLAGELPSDARWFVLDASAIAQVDSTAAAMLEEVRTTFAERGLMFGVAELHKEPMEILRRSGFLGKLGASMIFEDLEDVMPAFERFCILS
ncbi:SulP family inorganic anion transporter [Bosea caraganae]|uniref:SulP family inorganic anion transporter n=1 Tax=Bosea caraganae TaxID=2763117 RepID=A0A370LBD1_9HYPH|nr:SulP family inorganic anion transporter [Bosea caraganae]RDJ27240.1 SulP family inorganic anion transporter [Bosea caraganae]RDJ29256.1 SulP family inorganic anion transporter [Bosea caraganae]